MSDVDEDVRAVIERVTGEWIATQTGTALGAVRGLRIELLSALGYPVAVE